MVTVGQSMLVKIHWVFVKMNNSVADYFIKQNEERGELLLLGSTNSKESDKSSLYKCFL